MFARLSVVVALAGALFTLSLLPTRADTASDIKALQSAVKSLQSTVKSQQTTIGTLQTQNTSLQSQVNALKSLTKGLSRVSDSTRTDGLKGTELYITGMNLHIVNGLGATDGDPKGTGTKQVNGLGNVIIGYNTLRDTGSDNRTGSHNLVLGDYQDYSFYGGIVSGSYNAISGPYASITGGYYNTANGDYSSVTGGISNLASGNYSSVSGGNDRSATGIDDWAAGGYYQDH